MKEIISELVLFLVGVFIIGCMFFYTGCAITDADFELKSDATVKELEGKLADLDKKYNEEKSMNGDLLKEIEKLTSEKELLVKTLETLKEEYSYYMSIYTVGDAELADIIAKYEELIKEYNARIDSLDSKVSDYEKTISELKKIIEAKESEIIDINDNYRTVYLELKKYIELYNKSKDDTDEVINGYKKQIVELTKQMELLNIELGSLKADNEEYKNRYNDLLVKYENLSKEFLNKNNTIEELKIEIQKLIKENESLRNEIGNKTVYIKACPIGCDKRNWILPNGVVINNINLKNGAIEYNGYKFVFVE